MNDTTSRIDNPFSIKRHVYVSIAYDFILKKIAVSSLDIILLNIVVNA